MIINKKIFRATLMLIMLFGVVAMAFTGRRSPDRRQHLSRVYFAIDSTEAVNEFIKLQANYAGASYLSFDASYTEITQLGSIANARLDTFHYKINGNKYYMKGYLIEQCQDSNYNLIIYPTLQQLFVSQPSFFFKEMFQLDLMDGDFQIANVSNMVVKDTGAMRKLTVRFLAQSQFKSMDILYDTLTYRLKSINGSMSMQSALPGDPVGTSPLTTITMNFSNYQSNLFGDSVFNMNRYFTKQQDSLAFVHPYDTFQIVNSTLY